MKKIRLALILIHIFGGMMQIKCRKYDIEAEALKLYGENLETVVQRFRRTPEYRRILDEKIKEAKKMLNVILLQTFFNYERKLTNEINWLYAPHHENSLRSNILKPSPDITEDRIPSRIHMYRRWDSKNTNTGYEYKMKDRILRQEDANRETSKSPIEILDEKVADTYLPVAEKNHAQNVAFQFLGDAIHEIIKSMGPEDDDQPGQSTRFVVQGTRTTTEHPLIHTVSQPDISTDVTTAKERLLHQNMPLQRSHYKTDMDEEGNEK